MNFCFFGIHTADNRDNFFFPVFGSVIQNADLYSGNRKYNNDFK